MKHYALPKLDLKRLNATKICNLKSENIRIEKLKSLVRSLKQEKVNFETLKECKFFNRNRVRTSLDRFYDLYAQKDWKERHLAVAQKYFDDPKYVEVTPI